jgi:hypothetical protein
MKGAIAKSYNFHGDPILTILLGGACIEVPSPLCAYNLILEKPMMLASREGRRAR